MSTLAIVGIGACVAVIAAAIIRWAIVRRLSHARYKVAFSLMTVTLTPPPPAPAAAEPAPPQRNAAHEPGASSDPSPPLEAPVPLHSDAARRTA